MIRRNSVLLAAMLAAACCLETQPAARAAGTDGGEYLIGGPLAGRRLSVSKQNTGPGPEVELYPGSVEHWRGYMMKYLPVRSCFDAQSQLKNWVAPSIPGGDPARVEQYASPVYHQPDNGRAKNTGRSLPPVPVFRCGIGNPVFHLDLGELPIGLYAVRVIGAVETARLRDFRAPLFVTMRVNDGLQGETSTYRVRIGYVDEFYSVAEIYFHATEKRHFQADLFVDRGSTVDLLVHNITLDDVLAGAVRRPVKTRMTLTTPDEIEQLKAHYTAGQRRTVDRLKPLSREQRLARDAAIWKWLPPLNAQGLYISAPLPPGVTEGVADQTGEQIATEYGRWELAGGREMGNLDPGLGGVLNLDPKTWNAFLVNKRLGLEYTVDDLWAHKPLPDPFPEKDDGAGLYFPDSRDPKKGRVFAPIAAGVHRRLRPSPCMAMGAAKLWLQSGNREIARDAAVDLVRYAYQLPAVENRNFLNNVMSIPSSYERDSCCRQRAVEANWRSHYQNYLLALSAYDELFDFIRGNEDLAQSIHRFVPWVKTADDVIQLLDVYLVQNTAKRILRYQDHTLPVGIATVAAMLADQRVTDPWMEWLFSKTFVYPLQPAGIQDLMISGHDRSGPQYIGSTYYSQGEGARRVAAEIQPYLDAGGNRQYDLSDPARYPKPLAHCDWQLGITVGGADFLRIGDVCGPDKAPFATLGDSLEEASRFGWKWSADPRFAWILKNVFGRKPETDAEWAKITAAADSVKRAPWLDLPSRFVANWAGVLESGREHDDYRFRRAAYVRTGLGYGHNHDDTLDLQIVAHGLPMTIDGGQRSGYSKPNDRYSRIHNMVEVNGGGNTEYGVWTDAWVPTLSDADGARYLLAAAVPPPGARLYQRQVALIDVDEGQGSIPLTIAQQKPRAKLPAGVTTANSYVFDVFRVSGGKLHTYCFHGPVQDDFQWNALRVAPVATVNEKAGAADDAAYLSIFSLAGESKQAGDCPEAFQATWRYTRDGGAGSEQRMMGANFDEQSPRKFTRLTLLGAAGMRALKADVVETTQSPVSYRFTDVMLQQRGTNLESAFAAIVDPYVGQPNVVSERLLPVADNDADARRAVAVEVKTANGHTDICFADGRPERVRQFPISNFQSHIAAEFAYYSADASGLRQASLTGGTLLEAPGVTIQVARRERAGRVAKVDYLRKTLWLDQPWPAVSAGRAFEIGSPGHWTTYTSATVAPEGGGTRITVTGGADLYRSGITQVAPSSSRVDCVLSMPVGRAGLKAWVASNDQMTKFWRADCLGGNNFKLTGNPLASEDFSPSHALRLWEYGVGDAVRQSTFVSVRRLPDSSYEVQADTDAEITLAGITRHIRVADLEKRGGRVRLPAK